MKRRTALKGIVAGAVGSLADRVLAQVPMLGRTIPHGAGGGGGPNIANFNFLSSGWATFGLAMSQGTATSGVKIGSLATQTDVLRTWGDGSIRHALVTAQIGATGNMAINASTNPGGSFAPTWPSASVTVISGGVTYTSSLPSFTAADCYVSGALLRECKVITAFTGGSGAASHLTCVWYIRSYIDSTHEVTVVLKNGDIEAASANAVYASSLFITINGVEVFRQDEVPGANPLNYDVNIVAMDSVAHGLVQGDTVELTSGPQIGQHAFALTVESPDRMGLYSGGGYDGFGTFTVNQTGQTWKRNVALYFGCAFVFRFQVSGFAAATYTPDLSPYYDAYALIQFQTGISNDVYTDTDRNWSVPGVGTIQLPLAGDTGSTQLGHYPFWVAVWQEHLTQNQFNHMLLFADRLATLPGRFVKANGAIARHRDVGWENYSLDPGGSPRPAGMVGFMGAYQYDPAHHGSHFYVPYIITGRREYLDCAKECEAFMGQFNNFTFFNNWGTVHHQNQSRGGSNVFLGSSLGGARGWGWNLRGWSDMAAYLPDADADKSYFNAVMSDNVGWAESYHSAVTGDPNNVFGWMAGSTEGYYSIQQGTPDLVQFSYQAAYLAFGIHRCKQHGLMSTSALRNGLGKTELLRIQSDPSFPRSHGQFYNTSFGRAGIAYIKAISLGATPTITVQGIHYLNTGDSLTISGSDSTPSIDGTYTVTVITPSQFTISAGPVTHVGTTGLITGMPCPGGSVITDGSGNTTPFVYYADWASIYAATVQGFGNDATPVHIYDQQQYFLIQCAVQAGLPGAAAALTFAETFAGGVPFGSFSLARF